MNYALLSVRNLATDALQLFRSMTGARAEVFTYNSCPVTAVNQNAQTFTVHWRVQAASRDPMASYGGSSRTRIFRINDKTTYSVGSNKGSWADVIKGVFVTVSAHSEGSDRVADKVQIVVSGS